MPVFSCGGMRYQHEWKDVDPSEIPKANQENLEATIERAVDLGINHIETARGYGTSEMQLGNILPRLPREKLIVQTKVSPRDTAKEFASTFDLSMEYLKLDHVDLLSFHGINNEETLHNTLKKGGCLEVGRRLQKEGRVRFLGFSTHGSCDLITQAINSGEFDYVNLHWYFVNDLNWGAVLAATENDMGVFIISPNDKGGKLYEPPPKLASLCEPLSPMKFNDLYCLARPEVHTLSIGASKPSDFDEHIAALEFYDRAKETIAPVEARLREELKSVHGAGWAENWWRGLPQPEQIPGEVNVQEILRLWTLAKAFDLEAFGRMRYNLLGNSGHWFPGKKFTDEVDEKALLKAVSTHPFAGRIPSILREAHTMLDGEEKKRLSSA